MRKNKKIVAWILSAITMMSGVILLPEQAKAAGNTIAVQSEIQYEEMSYKTYSESWGKKAPTKEGYLFGGWYQDSEGKTAIRSVEQVTESAKVYAKFVPAHLLSVKAQNFSTTKRTEGDDKATTRMVSSIDCRAYLNVGFQIIDIEANRTITDEPINTVYEKLQVKEGSTTKDYTPQEIFGTVANAKEQNFIVKSLRNIPEAKWNSDIYVRPFWTTYDGLRIYGLGKYVYVNDGIDGWISIPVNLHTGASVAGGMISVKVPTGEGYSLTYQECRPGRVFSEMTAAIKGTTIKCVGHTKQGEDTAANDLYAVLRFKVEGSYKTGSGTFLEFNVKDLGFANNAETLVDMSIMNVQY